MSCSRCADLCQEVPIRTPGELDKVIRVARANLADDTIVEVRSATRSARFVDLAVGVPLPDIISTDFKCTECGEVFHLRCETYRGQGGNWSLGR